MPETNITRRRVMQGVGAVGFATIGGSAVINAQEGNGNENGDGDTAALRVAHASPDGPDVDVRLHAVGGDDGEDSGDDGNGMENGENGTENGENGTENGEDGEDSGENGANGGENGEADVSIDGVGFRDVSDYNEVEPGTYDVQIVVPENGLLDGLLDDFLDDGEGGDGDTVIFDDELEMEAGTAYTAVAFGEVARGPVPAEDAEVEDGEDEGVGMEENGMEENGMEENGMEDNGQNGTEENGGNGTEENAGENGDAENGGTADGRDIGELSFGEHETLELDANDYTVEFRQAGMDDGAQAGEMEEDGMEDNGQNSTEENGENGGEEDGSEMAEGEEGTQETGAGELGFQVSVLEDDVMGPGEAMSRVRIFHAVPDVETMSISMMTDEELAEEDADGDQEDDDAVDEEGVGDEGAGNEGAGNEGAGNEGAGDDAAGDGMNGDQDDSGGEPADQQAQEGDVRGEQVSLEGGAVYSGFAVGYFDPDAAATADDGADEEDEVLDDGNDTGEENVQNDTGEENGEADGEEEEVAEEPDDDEFELVTVQDAQDGERADGGTGDGILSVAPTALD